MKAVLALALLGLAVVTLVNADATESGECYSDPRGKDYRGVVTWTNGGSHGVARRCNNWENQSPHKHTMTPSNRPGTGLGMHSYCRNPDNMSGGPWCYTTDSSIRWQYCNVGDPKPCPGADCDNVGTTYDCDQKSYSCNEADTRRLCPKTCGACPVKAKREDSLESLIKRYLESKEKMAEQEQMAEHK